MTKDWQELELGALFDFSSGKSITPGGDGLYPAFGSNGLIGRSEKSLFDAGIIIGRVGAYCGSTAISTSPFWASDNTIVALPKEGLDLRFGYYLLSNARLNRHAGGAAQPLLTQATIKPLRFPVPSLTNQRRIVSVLGAYDDLIEVNGRRIVLLEEMARRLFEEWFVRFRFPGHEGHKMVETPDGPVPELWERVPVGAILERAIGGTWGADAPDNKNTEVCYVLRGTDFPRLSNGGFREMPRRFVPSNTLSSRTLRHNDIVLEVSGGSKDQPVGRAVFVTDQLLRAIGGTSTFASFCRLVRVNVQRASPYHLFWHIDRMYRTRTIEAYQSQSTGLRNFKFTVFAEKELLTLPPQSVKERFDSISAPFMGAIATLSCQIDSLRRSRDLLLPGLISGELTASSAERELEAVA